MPIMPIGPISLIMPIGPIRPIHPIGRAYWAYPADRVGIWPYRVDQASRSGLFGQYARSGLLDRSGPLGLSG